jgi:prepilin-type processing-associated H-X9-DG protein
VAIYKCPADKYLSQPQRALGWKERVRSLAMNAFMGPYNSTWTSDKNRWEEGYRQFLKSSSIPKPSTIFVTLDEHPNSINDGFYLNTSGNRGSTFGDVPANYHNNAFGLSFADGHSEIHKWNGAWLNDPTIRTIPWGSGNFPGVALGDAAGRADFEWLWERTSVPVN